MLVSLAHCQEGGCPSDIPSFYENAHYHVRRVQLSGPFLKVGTVASVIDRDRLPKEGAEFSAASFEEGRSALREALLARRTLFDSPIGVTVVLAGFTNCESGARPPQVEIVYRIFTSKLSPSFGTFEVAKATPENAAQAGGEGNPAPRLDVLPFFRYNDSEKFLSGGSLRAALGRAGLLELSGAGSNTAMQAEGALTGSLDTQNPWWNRMNWRLAYSRFDRPSDRNSLQATRVFAQIVAASKAIGKAGAVFRYGAALEGGNQHSLLPVPAGTIADTGYGQLKSFAGVSFHAGANAISGSYGLALGTARHDATLDYQKHLANLEGYFRFLPRGCCWDNRPIEIEARLSAGGIFRTKSGLVPAVERFFGGNVASQFLSGAGWEFPAGPVVRSIPAYRFATDPAGNPVGSDNFVSLNLTASTPVWKLPLIPQSFKDAGLAAMLEGELMSAFNTLVSLNNVRDSHHQAIFSRKKEILDVLEAVTTAANAVVPDSSELSGCKDALDASSFRIDDAKKTSYLGDFVGSVDSDTLVNAYQLCRKVADAGLRQKLQDLKSLIESLQAEFLKIDVRKAEFTTVNDLTFARGVLRAFLNEVNAVAVSPVILFDAARLGFRNPSSHSTAYAVGGGMRFTLVDSVALTFTYAWNPDRQPYQPAGAFLWEFKVLDLSRLFH